MKQKIKQKPSNLPKARHIAGSPRVVIFDGMNFAHAAFHAYKKLSYKGQSTSIIFGMPTMISSILMRHKWTVDNVIIAWDGKKSKKRMKWVPGYKSHREIERDKNPEARIAFLNQCKKVRRLFYYMGIVQAYDKQLEGDDMIYHLVKEAKKTNKVVVVSGDKDMLQLVDNDVTVYNQRSDTLNVPELIGAHLYGLKVHQLVDFFCLVGDNSDNIPGYRGIGEIRASKFLEQFNSIEDYLNSKKEYSGLTDKDQLRKIYRLNRKMIDLKWFNDRYFKDYEIRFFKNEKFPSFKEPEFNSLCSRYNMKTFLTNQFKDFFKKLCYG